MEQIPRHFYRYRSLAGNASEYVRKTIQENEIYFAKPSSFNDPFDCCPTFDFNASDNEIIDYFVHILRRNSPQLSEEELNSEAHVIAMLHDTEKSIRNPSNQLHIQQLHTKNITEKVGALCMATTNKDVLMWSHYADYHRGIVLCFDGCLDFFKNTHRVNYAPKRPIINPFRDSSELMMEAALLTKAKHWKYEKEWRLIRYEGGSGKAILPSTALTGVILGSRISPEDEEKVVSWVQSRRVSIEILRASQSLTNYSLSIAKTSSIGH